MKMCSFGFETCFPYESLTNIDFSSDETILEYDVLFLDLSKLFDNYFSRNSFDYEEYKGRPKLNERDSVKIKRDFEKRKDELIEFLESGKTVIIFNGNDQCVVRYTGATKISGTGKNAKPIYSLEGVHSRDYLPVKVQSVSLKGSSIDIVNASIKEKFKKFLPCFTYLCTYKNVDSSLMTIHSTNKCVAYFEVYGKGMIIFAPDLYYTENVSSDFSKIEVDYLNALCTLPNILRKKDTELPEYSYDYYLPDEKDTSMKIEKLQRQIDDKIKKLEGSKGILNNIQSNKIFFTGTGTPLEMNVRDMLEDIGFTILFYDPDGVRKDIEIGYKDKVAVVEVKGVSGSATEAHVAQTVKWKMEYFTDNNVMPKGILIVNAFNTRKLEDRQDYFPEQLLKFAKSQEIGLFTTIQIYNIKCYLEKNPNSKDEIIDSMFKCIGRYDRFMDWKENIEEKSVN